MHTLFSCSKLWQCEITFTQRPHPAHLPLLPREWVFQHRPGAWVYVWLWATPRSCAPGTAPIPAWQWTYTPVHTWGLRLWTATSSTAFVSSINSRDWHELKESGRKKKKVSVSHQSNVRYVTVWENVIWNCRCLIRLDICTIFHICVISSSQFSRCLTQHISMMKWLTHFSHLEQSSGEKQLCHLY